MQHRIDLTRGPIAGGLLRFCVPLIIGNLLQQLYNVVDTWVVGRYLGQAALAAVGSAFSLLTLLTSIVLGLCMGAGAVLGRSWGEGDQPLFRRAAGSACWLCVGTASVLTVLACVFLPWEMSLLRVPETVQPGMQSYLSIVLPGLLFTGVYNYFANLQRSAGNSVTPLIFLAASAGVNIVLDILLVAVWPFGIAGAALATLIAQLLSAVGIAVYTLLQSQLLLPKGREWLPDLRLMQRIFSVSSLTAVQQSVMNFGILMIQSLVNSFGAQVMAAFAVGVKIDAFAYAPAQDFANGYATFVSQNNGAGDRERIRHGIRTAFLLSACFCAVVSAVVALLAPQLMQCFMGEGDAETIAIGVSYLRTEGLCYIGIGVLFLLYATFRGMEKAGVSVILTVVSLGLRVLLAYTLAPAFGTAAIWWSIPIGWLIADLTGMVFMKKAGLFAERS